ncbi:MAG: HAD family phosphatase [Spirochaetaceae bacterium]|nr:HAD family phosphatase [Spirochaetaceae bacterium]
MNKTLRYKCLFLDHDDTSVNSTPIIHHRAHIEVMKIMRPQLPPLSLDEWFKKNFNPGIMEYMKEDLLMTDEEVEIEYGIWRKFAVEITSDFFPGIIETLIQYRNRGGKIVVVSHSDKDLIERDYKTNGFFGKDFFLPDMIFGWTTDATKRKPNPWPVFTSLESFGIAPKDSIIIDDLRPGVVMGKNSGVDVVAAGWSHNIPEIKQYMKENTIAYLNSVEEFKYFLLT